MRRWGSTQRESRHQPGGRTGQFSAVSISALNLRDEEEK